MLASVSVFTPTVFSLECSLFRCCKAAQLKTEANETVENKQGDRTKIKWEIQILEQQWLYHLVNALGLRTTG